MAGVNAAGGDQHAVPNPDDLNAHDEESLLNEISEHELTVASQLAELAKKEHGNEVLVNGERRTTISRVNQVINGLRLISSKTTVDPETHVYFTKLHNMAGVCKGKTVALDLDSCLANPQDVPFIVAHEFAHAGYMKSLQGKATPFEGISDMVAKRAAGMDLDTDYDEETATLEGMARTLESAGYQDGEGMLIDYYAKDKLSDLLKILVNINLKEGEKDARDPQATLHSTFATFKIGFPGTQVQFDGQHIVPEEQVGQRSAGNMDLEQRHEASDLKFKGFHMGHDPRNQEEDDNKKLDAFGKPIDKEDIN